MLEDFCAAEPAPTRDWLAAERAKLGAAIGAGQRHAIRFRWPMPSRTAMAASAAAIAAVAALAAVVVIPSGHAGPQARIQTAAYVISHTESALSATAAENPVVYVHTSDGSGIEQSLGIGGPGGPRGSGTLRAQQVDAWYYGPNYYPARYRGFTAAGQPVFDSSVTATSGAVVDYQARIWWRYTPHIPAWIPPHGSSLQCHDVGALGGPDNPVYWPADLRKLMACGVYTTAGTEQVDGVDAIKMTQIRPDSADTVLWVDPSTYLPVRVEVRAQAQAGKKSNQFAWTDDLRWLSPTAANLAKLTVTIPSGFVQVPAPPHANSLDSSCLGGNPKCLAPWNAWYAKYVAPRL